MALRKGVGSPLRVLVWWLRFNQMGTAVIATLLAWVGLGPYRKIIMKTRGKGVCADNTEMPQVILRKNWKSHVYVVHRDGRQYVVKRFLGNVKERAKMFVEVGHLSRLIDTGITPKLLGFDPVGCAIFMEHIEGSTLKENIYSAGALDKASSLETYNRVFAQFSNLHQHGVFLNDVTLKNILIEEGGGVRVIDFADSVSVRSLPRAVRQMFYASDLDRLRHLFSGVKPA